MTAGLIERREINSSVMLIAYHDLYERVIIPQVECLLVSCFIHAECVASRVHYESKEVQPLLVQPLVFKSAM